MRLGLSCLARNPGAQKGRKRKACLKDRLEVLRELRFNPSGIVVPESTAPWPGPNSSISIIAQDREAAFPTPWPPADPAYSSGSGALSGLHYQMIQAGLWIQGPVHPQPCGVAAGGRVARPYGTPYPACLVPSLKGLRSCPTPLPALTCWANECRPCGTGVRRTGQPQHTL